MTRARRLESAKRWVPTHSGRNLVRRYRKRYGVDELCAVVELRMLGVDLPDARLEQARRNERDRAALRAQRRQRRRALDSARDSDDTFAFIAGYTEGGAPYGITWEEMEADENAEAPSPAPGSPRRRTA